MSGLISRSFLWTFCWWIVEICYSRYT
jgi:hypothetical protein